MNRLLHAGFKRFVKKKAVWIGILILTGYEAVCILLDYQSAVRWNVTVPLDEVLFIMMAILGVVISVFCSMFVGTEYSDGTLRNKIAVGRKRSHIYLSNYILCAFGGAAAFLLSLAGGAAIGSPLLEPLRATPAYMLELILTGVFISFSYAAVFNLISMIVSSKAHSAIFCILAAFAFLFVAYYLYMMLSQPEMSEQYHIVDGQMKFETLKNPHYVTGLKRDIYQFLMEFLPGGQSLLIMEGIVIQPFTMMLYSAVIAVVTNAAGLLLFCKKELK